MQLSVRSSAPRRLNGYTGISARRTASGSPLNAEGYALFPAAETVLGLHYEQFASAGLTFKRRPSDIPRQQPYTGQAITQQRRLDLLRRFATSTDIPIRPRAAACLILLYAQPLSRILRLSAADLTRDDAGQTWLRLGDPPSPVPPPFDALLRQLAATRHDHVPANHASGWLFPGRHAGQPADYRSMAAQLRDHGLPLRTARISALRQLVLQVPAPVIAGALGFHHTTTTRQHVNAGATWSRYAGGGDHQG